MAWTVDGNLERNTGRSMLSCTAEGNCCVRSLSCDSRSEGRELPRGVSFSNLRRLSSGCESTILRIACFNVAYGSWLEGSALIVYLILEVRDIGQAKSNALC